MRYKVDDTGVLEKFASKLISKHHPIILAAGLRFLYVWRSKPVFSEGRRILGTTFKLGKRERDLFDFDVRIEIDQEAWNELSKKEKYKLIDHELMHIRVEREGELEPSLEENSPADTRDIKEDKEGRVCFSLQPHDLDIRRFKEELKRYGLSEEEDTIRMLLNDIYETSQKEKEE